MLVLMLDLIDGDFVADIWIIENYLLFTIFRKSLYPIIKKLNSTLKSIMTTFIGVSFKPTKLYSKCLSIAITINLNIAEC